MGFARPQRNEAQRVRPSCHFGFMDLNQKVLDWVHTVGLPTARKLESAVPLLALLLYNVGGSEIDDRHMRTLLIVFIRSG